MKKPANIIYDTVIEISWDPENNIHNQLIYDILSECFQQHTRNEPNNLSTKLIQYIFKMDSTKNKWQNDISDLFIQWLDHKQSHKKLYQATNQNLFEALRESYRDDDIGWNRIISKTNSWSYQLTDQDDLKILIKPNEVISYLEQYNLLNEDTNIYRYKKWSTITKEKELQFKPYTLEHINNDQDFKIFNIEINGTVESKIFFAFIDQNTRNLVKYRHFDPDDENYESYIEGILADYFLVSIMNDDANF